MGAYLSCIKTIFPCMSGQGDGTSTTTISIKSTSSCCRGKIVQLKLDNEQLKDLNAIVSQLVTTALQDKESNLTVV